MAHKFLFRFVEADRAVYGDGEYGLDVSPDGLGEVSMGLLEEFEEQTGMRVLGDWLDRLGRNELKAVRAYMWLAYRVADASNAMLFADFEPNVVGAMASPDFRYVGDAEGNAASPATNRATRRQSPKKSSASSTKRPRRASGS